MGGEGKEGLMKSRDIILVPDLDATALTALAKERCQLTVLDEGYEKWNYLVGLDGKPISGRGKEFEVLTWKPGRDVLFQEVHKYFSEKGFYGHTAAFTAWVAEHSPAGYHASILEDSACGLHSNGDLGVPVSCFYRDNRELRYFWQIGPWYGRWCFVAFREL